MRRVYNSCAVSCASSPLIAADRGVALAGTRQFRSLGQVFVHAHRSEGITGSKGREGANQVGGGIGAEGGDGDANGVGGGNVNDDRDGAGTRSGVERKEGTEIGKGNGSGNRDGGVDPWTNTGWGRERGRKREQ